MLMSKIIGRYLITCTIGSDMCEVRAIGYIDKFGRLCNNELVFRHNSWSECVDYASGIYKDYIAY